MKKKRRMFTNSMGHCDRCSTVVEPKVSSQWFVNAEELAKEAIRVVETKEIRIVPEEWEKTYFEWMRNIRAPGASAASSGGGIGYRRGIARTARRLPLTVAGDTGAMRTL